MDDWGPVFITEDQKYLHTRCNIADRLSGNDIGRIFHMIMHYDRVPEIKDSDIVWNNDTPTLLQPDTLRDSSSGSNEYYTAETVYEGQHLELEAVN